VFRKMQPDPVRMLGIAHLAAGLGSTKDLEDNAALGSKAAEDKVQDDEAAEDKVHGKAAEDKVHGKAAADKVHDEAAEGSEDQDKAGDNVAGRQAQGETLEEAGEGSKAAEVQDVLGMGRIEAQDKRAEDSVAQDDSEVEDMPEEGKMVEDTQAQE